MKVFLIVLAVIVVIFALICSISATFTIIYDKSWTTKIKVLWIEKDIKLTKILSFVLFPKENAEKIKAEKAAEKQSADAKKESTAPAEEVQAEPVKQDEKPAEVTQAEQAPLQSTPAPKTEKAPQKQKKPNFIKSLWDKEGIVGIMELVSNMLQTASSALGTLFKGFHIYSLYVKIIVGGNDAAEIAQAYGRIASYYYPVKGIIANGMKVDNYDDCIFADYLAPANEFEFQFIGSISIGLLLRVALSAGKTFLVNLIKK